MNWKIWPVVAVLGLASWFPAKALVITDFSAASFTVDSGTSSFPTIQVNPGNVAVDGTDFGESLAGTFVPVDVTGLDQFSLSGSIGGTNPGSAFTVLLFNSSFDQVREYSGSLSDFGSGSSSVVLTLVSESAPFTDIAGFQFIGGGSGSPLAMTFEGLTATAVPEPSTWVLLVAAGGLLVIRLQRSRWSSGPRTV